MDHRIVATEALIAKHLESQKRGDGSSNAAHARRVSVLLVSALSQSGESPSPDEVITLTCAALGHDVLEDSDETAESLERVVGPQALHYIQELTNTWGDDHTGPYVVQVVSASEEARLIKYADLTDNLFHASFQAQTLGKTWMQNFFLPIVDPMREALETSPFERYPKTASVLRASAALARAHLEESIRGIK